MSTVLLLALAAARIDGVESSAIVLGAGAGAFGIGLSSARRTTSAPRAHSVRMLTELRERVRIQGTMPSLPSGWRIESADRAAGDDSFAGDFVIGNRTDEDRFEVVLVDVSGNGLDAGSRSMLMGGAVSGLLGPVAPGDFLPAANDYLVRQGWSEGFATAIHLCVDLSNGQFSVGSAGHPSAALFRGSTQTWSMVDGASGTCLGVLEGQDAQDYPRAEGILESGDALLLYSDGVVETRDLDLGEGLRQVLSTVQAAPTSVGAAALLCDARRAGSESDRTVVLLCRE